MCCGKNVGHNDGGVFNPVMVVIKSLLWHCNLSVNTVEVIHVLICTLDVNTHCVVFGSLSCPFHLSNRRLWDIQHYWTLMLVSLSCPSLVWVEEAKP